MIEEINGIDCSWYEDCVYYKQLKRLEQKYNEVLKLSKEGMDAQEYCLQEDEEIIRNLKEEHNHYIDIINELKKENEELEKALKPFKDDYFKNLSNEQIAELAKKSIRLTTENRELENRLEIADKQMADEEAKHYAMEEEIEQLKALKDTYFTCYKAKHNDIEGELFKLREENEELKEKIENYKMYGCSDVTQPNAYVVDSVYQGAIIGKEIYRKALEEIKKIVLENPWEETDNWIKGKILEVLESEGE